MSVAARGTFREPHPGGAMRRAGLLVVNRLELMRKAERAGSIAQRKPALPISVGEVFRRYRGFDGVAWPVEGHPPLRAEDGLADLGDLALAQQYARTPPVPEENDLILVVYCGPNDEGPPGHGWVLVGFDVGYFESEWSHFSVVLNEVIWGTIEQLRSFAARLNEHLLFDDIADARDLVREHDALAGEGKDVEQGKVEPCAIYVPQSVNVASTLG